MVKWLCMAKSGLQSRVLGVYHMWSWAVGCTVVFKCTVCGVVFSQFYSTSDLSSTQTANYFHNDEKTAKRKLLSLEMMNDKLFSSVTLAKNLSCANFPEILHIF